MSDKVLLLISGITTDQIQVVEQRTMEQYFAGKFISYELLDGALPENKELRDHLFHIGEHYKGKYPQCFIHKADGTYEFIGLFEKIQSLAECDALPSDMLEANPAIETLTKVFGHIPKTR